MWCSLEALSWPCRCGLSPKRDTSICFCQRRESTFFCKHTLASQFDMQWKEPFRLINDINSDHLEGTEKLISLWLMFVNFSNMAKTTAGETTSHYESQFNATKRKQNSSFITLQQKTDSRQKGFQRRYWKALLLHEASSISFGERTWDCLKEAFPLP